MKVIILCGGQGTRLREETEYRPKPLVEVGGKPILWHIMKTYAHHGFREFVLCLGYRGNMIKEYFLNYEAMNNDFTICLGQKSQLDFNGAHKEQDFRVTLADTGQETMTGGRIKRIEKYVDGDTFLVTYGDGLADVNIADLLAFHKTHGKLKEPNQVLSLNSFQQIRLSKAFEFECHFQISPKAERRSEAAGQTPSKRRSAGKLEHNPNPFYQRTTSPHNNVL